VLLRPDGYVAWIGEDQRELPGRLAHWFGRPGGADRPGQVDGPRRAGGKAD
jgi:hypothetical protein